ncbi:MAG: DUF5615 family PIN-like protein [Anaerolineae bacterium]|nr:DUF5615 family PIN-like protein [Anaerolineae bacterium]
MTIRLYIDEDSMSRALVRALRARGVDVTTALDEEMIEQPDLFHLQYASEQGRVLYSFNVGDFFNLHTLYLQEGKSHPGMILCPQQTYSVGEQMRRLLKLIATKSAHDMQNTVEFLGKWG